jgi:hypothetical protein
MCIYVYLASRLNVSLRLLRGARRHAPFVCRRKFDKFSSGLGRIVTIGARLCYIERLGQYIP